MSTTNTTTTQMNPDVFTQLYQSLTPIMNTPQESSSMFDEWLKQDFLSEGSMDSPPEITTPLDQFLMSPPFPSKEDTSEQTFKDNLIDMDVSAILNSPIELSYPSTPAPMPIPQMTNLFADLGNSLPAALAALAAVATPLPVDTPRVETVSPAVTSASTPIFSTATRTNTKKRAAEDVGDEIALKRQKNTDAARRSRLRKVQKMETLEVRVSELEKMNGNLLMRIAVLDSEKLNLKVKESSYENRIKLLEQQLTEAHKALSCRS
ncbi:hypothetical protein BDB01DRAFT_839707 [Pilobolus umbonatus]|nr:hypothetical protein BDB01DRAFT_839707 [Pilobolus umbonatus]